MSRAGAFNPLMFGMGITMIGPTILDYGTENQKRCHIPPIVRGDVRWCVGYSEPNAGSDLASLQTKCEDAGDHWRINGQKIWTSGAQYSDWCGALVRTDTSTKHDGISFMLINMRQPAVETRPIRLIAGASPFCETFFTDARAEKDDMLGDINKGWTVGKRLLQHERSSQTGAPPTGGARAAPLQEMAKSYVGVDDVGRLADKDLRTRITRHLIDSRAHALTLARAQAEAKGGSVNPSNAASVLKNSATNVAQTRSELTLEIMGGRGKGWEGEGFSDEQIAAVRGWLSGRAISIYGGSAEIQNNIISKRILGLPDLTNST
jgi:alkylation response protein AidB-like acyl-CoA dehydrogenase